jgi:hypothetical protein
VTLHSGAYVRPLLQRTVNKYYTGVFWVSVYSLRYLACNAHAPYCHLWPAHHYKIFPYYLTNGTIFEKKTKLLNTKCVFWFSLQLLSDTFIALRIAQRDTIKNVKWYGRHVNCMVFLSDFKETWICSTDFSKYTQISNLMKIRPVGADLFHADGQTDGRTHRHDEANTNFSQVCEGAKYLRW